MQVEQLLKQQMRQLQAQQQQAQMLRETLGKDTRTDLMEMCKAAGIGGCSNKRKDELIDLLVRKKTRPGEQVHYAGAPDRTGLRGLRAVRSMPRLYCAA